MKQPEVKKALVVPAVGVQTHNPLIINHWHKTMTFQRWNLQKIKTT